MRSKKQREALALLKVLELSARDVENGRVKPFRAAFADIRRRARDVRARAALLARLKKQKATRAGRWTRDDLYDER